MTQRSGPGPLVILGIDAGDPGFIERWAAEGHMPAVASLMRRGSAGRTGGPELVSEHGVWTSLFSGLSRVQHGYHYFREIVPGRYALRARSGVDVVAAPFWTRLGPGARVAVIDAPDTMPVPGPAGFQLCNWATHDNWDPDHYPLASEPPELASRVVSRFGPKLVSRESQETTPDEDRRLLRQLLDQTRRKGELCRALLSGGSYDVAVCVFSASHAAAHQFWGYRPEIAGGEGDPQLARGVRDVYAAVDREIGALLDVLPADADVFVVSSVGIDDHFPTTGLVGSFLRELGYLAPAPPGRRPIDWVRRRVPEPWRIAVSRRLLSREARERLLSDQLGTGADWSRTRAYAIPASYSSFLRVNLRGREPAGCVAPGADYFQVLDDLESDLEQLVDAETGEAAVSRISRTVEIFGCEPHATLPDLFVDWKPGRFLRRVCHPRALLGQDRPDFFRRSDHSSCGFVAAAGPRLRRGVELGAIDVLDLAPTFLALRGRDKPPEQRGRVLRELLAAP